MAHRVDLGPESRRCLSGEVSIRDRVRAVRLGMDADDLARRSFVFADDFWASQGIRPGARRSGHMRGERIRVVAVDK